MEKPQLTGRSYAMYLRSTTKSVKKKKSSCFTGYSRWYIAYGRIAKSLCRFIAVSSGLLELIYNPDVPKLLVYCLVLALATLDTVFAPG